MARRSYNFTRAKHDVAAIHAVVVIKMRRHRNFPRRNLFRHVRVGNCPVRYSARFQMFEIFRPGCNVVHVHRAVPVKCLHRETWIRYSCQHASQTESGCVRFNSKLHSVKNQIHAPVQRTAKCLRLKIRNNQFAFRNLIRSAAGNSGIVEPLVRQIQIVRRVMSVGFPLAFRNASLA